MENLALTSVTQGSSFSRVNEGLYAAAYLTFLSYKTRLVEPLHTVFETMMKQHKQWSAYSSLPVLLQSHGASFSSFQALPKAGRQERQSWGHSSAVKCVLSFPEA